MHSLLNLLYVATNVSPGNLPQVTDTSGDAKKIIDIVFAVIGAFSMLMVAVSGLRYILSNGDPQKTARAKDGIIYALVGVALAVSAEAILIFVVKSL